MERRSGTKSYTLEILLATLQKGEQGGSRRRRGVRRDPTGVRARSSRTAVAQVRRRKYFDQRARSACRWWSARSQDGKFKTLFIGEVEWAPGRPRHWSGPSSGRAQVPSRVARNARRGRRTWSRSSSTASYCATTALVALGLTLIFAIMGFLNFARQMYMFGGFVVYYVYAVFGLDYFVALLACALTLFVIGVLFERLFFRQVLRIAARGEQHAARGRHGAAARERGADAVRRVAARRAADRHWRLPDFRRLCPRAGFGARDLRSR